MSMLNKRINQAIDALLAAGEEIVHAEAADQFIADNAELIETHIAELVKSQIAAAIKSRTQAPAPPLGQGLLFSGLDAAITVRAGVTKPIGRCTMPDLQIGAEYKRDNVKAARERLRAYERDVAILARHMPDDVTTVEEAARQIKPGEVADGF